MLHYATKHLAFFFGGGRKNMLFMVENREVCKLKVVRRHHNDSAAKANETRNVCKRGLTTQFMR
jgi:hypothetical protein